MITDLTALDRCDRCGAAAKAVTEFEAGELLFCGHHWRANRSVLIEKAKSYFVEPDQEDFIIQKQKEKIEIAG